MEFINFGCWFVIAFIRVNNGVSTNFFIQLALIICVGNCMGLAYVNIMYQLLNDEAVKKSQKELAMNIIAFFNDFSVIFASLIALALNHTILKYN